MPPWLPLGRGSPADAHASASRPTRGGRPPRPARSSRPTPERLAAGDDRITLFAPDNLAIEECSLAQGGIDLADPDTARDFVLAHLFVGDVLLADDLASRADITLEGGTVRLIDGGVTPITIDGIPLQLQKVARAVALRERPWAFSLKRNFLSLRTSAGLETRSP